MTPEERDQARRGGRVIAMAVTYFTVLELATEMESTFINWIMVAALLAVSMTLVPKAAEMTVDWICGTKRS